MDTTGIDPHNGDSTITSPRLLAAHEPGPVFAQRLGERSPFLLLGDHAGRAIPARLEGLGLPPAELDRHIAWDIGVQNLGLALSEALGAPFIAQRYSRLVIDCNRDPSRPDAIPAISDGTTIAGNQQLKAADRGARISEIFDPYHAAVAAELDHRAATGQSTVVIALHSFTPVFAGFARPWLYGVLHMHDSALSHTLLAALREAESEAVVGDNEPYSMDMTDYTVPFHARRRALDYAELEVRQDLIADEAGVAAVARLIGGLLKATALPTRPGDGLG